MLIKLPKFGYKINTNPEVIVRKIIKPILFLTSMSFIFMNMYIYWDNYTMDINKFVRLFPEKTREEILLKIPPIIAGGYDNCPNEDCTIGPKEYLRIVKESCNEGVKTIINVPKAINFDSDSVIKLRLENYSLYTCQKRIRIISESFTISPNEMQVFTIKPKEIYESESWIITPKNNGNYTILYSDLDTMENYKHVIAVKRSTIITSEVIEVIKLFNYENVSGIILALVFIFFLIKKLWNKIRIPIIIKFKTAFDKNKDRLHEIEILTLRINESKLFQKKDFKDYL